MEPKRELTSVDLAALSRELARYEGARVEKTYLYEDGLVRVKMREFDLGRIELLIDTGETKHARVAAPDNVPAAPDRPPNFAMMLRNLIEGAELVGVDQFEFDRILTFEFDRGDGGTTIVAELFGDGNLAVLDEVGDVVDCLQTVRLKSRTVAPGARYEFPDARFNPLRVDREEFVARLEQSDTDVVRTLATQLNFGGFWGEELCTRAGVTKTLDIGDATESDFAALFDAVQDLAARLDAGDVDPRVYYDSEIGSVGDGASPDGGDDVGDAGDSNDAGDAGDSNGAGDGGEAGQTAPDDGPAGRRVDVTPLPMAEYEHLEREGFDRFTDALDDYFTNFEADAETVDATSDRPDFESEIETKERIIAQQEGAIEDFQAEADETRAAAESLYAHYDLVDEILSTTREARAAGTPWDDIEERFDEGAERGIEAAEAVQSVDGSQGRVTIDLDGRSVTLEVDDGVEKNADRLYTEAKRIEEKQEGAKEAIGNTREELEALERRREEWEAADGDGPDASAEGESDEEEAEDIDWLSRSSIPIRQSEAWYEDFRWFHTSDGFLVIGGRNADQNEAIVKKYLDPGDRFLHAQAHGGPVTVLKATGPSEAHDGDVEIPEGSLQEAAQFAVSYSSVWKDGKFSGDAYMVDHDQVSKTPESGEYLEKGGFAIRGDRTYFEDVAVGVGVGITCEPETRVIGGPPSAVRGRAETVIELEPGKYAQNDMAKRCYREFKERFADQTFVRKIASPDLIQEFLPPGTSSMVPDDGG